MLKSILILGSFICLILSGCVASHSLQTGNTGGSTQNLLRVGITPNARPMSYREDGRIAGLEAEFAQGLADYTHRKLIFVELPWKKQIPALLEGKTDIIMSAMTITPARNYQITFTDPYMITAQVSLVRLRDINRFGHGLTDLLSQVVRVGTVEATTGDLLIIKNKSRGIVLHFRDAKQGVQGLLDNQIDAFVYDLPMNFYLGAKYADQGLVPVAIPMTRENLAWGIRRNDSELKESANAYLKGLKTTGRLQQMIIHWIPFYQSVYNIK